MHRILRPLVLLLAAAAALLPAVPLDLLYCRCTGSFQAGGPSVDCCGAPTPAEPSCCGPARSEPAADAAPASGHGCMLAFHVDGNDAAVTAPRTDDASPATASAPAAAHRLPAPADAGFAAAAGAPAPGLLSPPSAHRRI